MKLELVLAPNPILYTPCNPVTVIKPRHKELAASMLHHMKLFKGVGLSANQVGRNIALFVANDGVRKLVAFNPEIMLYSGDKEIMKESCLSSPDIWLEKERDKQIVLSYQDINGMSKTETFRGFMAQIIQHEMLHMTGIEFA